MANTEEIIEKLDTIVNGIKDGKSPYNDVLQVWLEEAIRHLKEKNQIKIGHWIDEQINSYTNSTKCSECGKSPPFVFASDDYYGRDGYGKTEYTKYCPNCGAKMEG